MTSPQAHVSSSGNVAHDAADSGNPVKIGGKANTSLPSAVAASDRVDGMFDVYGRLVTIPYVAGASEVKAETVNHTVSATRQDIVAGQAGVKYRIIAVIANFDNATAATTVSIYFGDGANGYIDTSKSIVHTLLDLTDHPEIVLVFPDGAGPVGAAEDEISHREDVSTGNIHITVIYREE